MGMKVHYQFEWDPEKAKINKAKHKISFEIAATVFLDPNALTIFDKEHSNEEDRWVTMGINSSGILIVVCHTFVEEKKNYCLVRLFSARKATKNESNCFRGLEK